MEELKNVVYIVIDQGIPCDVNYEELYWDSEIIYVYCRDVSVTIKSFSGDTKQCQLFSFTKLPQAITSGKNYHSKIKKMSAMMSKVLANLRNKFIIWTFAIKVDHIGTYIQFMHSLETRGKKLIFHLSAADVETLTNDALFASISRRYVNEGTVKFQQLEAPSVN